MEAEASLNFILDVSTTLTAKKGHPRIRELQKRANDFYESKNGFMKSPLMIDGKKGGTETSEVYIPGKSYMVV
jgi:hypothetical protein